MTLLSEPPSAPMTTQPLPSVNTAPDIDLKKFRNTDQAKKLVAWVHDNYRKCESARTSEKLRWYKNLAMYDGNQYAEFMMRNGERKLFVLPKNRQKERQVINRIRPSIRVELARLLSQKPSASVIPASAEDEDLFAALAAEQVWQSISNRRKLHRVFSETAFWTVIAGSGFLKTYWDPNLLDRDSNMQGDVCYENVQPFNLFVPDLRAREIEDQPYVINMYTKPVEWVKHYFAKELEGIDLRPTVVSRNTLAEEVYFNLSGAEEAAPDSCMIYEAWVKPGATALLPNGGLITLVDTHIVGLTDQGLPYQHEEYPFTKIDHIPTARFYGDSIIVDVEGLQKDYNSLRSQIAETRKKMAKVQLLAQKGSIVASKMTNEIGLVVEFRGMPPTPIPLSELPSYVIQEQDRILLDFEDITGQHQVSKGNTPPGVTAATAISFLQEKDDSYLVHTYQSIEQGYEKIGRHTLNLVVQFWDAKRMVKVVGEDGAFDTLLLMGADLVNSTDLRTEPGSALPQSKAAKQAFVMDLMNQGHIPSQEGLELLEVGGAQKILDKLQVDKRQAQRENIRLKSLTDADFQAHEEMWQQAQAQMDPGTLAPDGTPLPKPPIVTVNTWDNHAVHIEIHNLFRRSQAFERCSPNIKAAFEEHIQMHKLAMMSEQFEDAALGLPGAEMPGMEDGGDPEAGANAEVPGAEEEVGIPEFEEPSTEIPGQEVLF